MNDKKKYYMRGLGFGILITAIILTLVHLNDRMTDEKAVKRAIELGYVYGDGKQDQNQTIDINALKNKLTSTPAVILSPEDDDPVILPNGDPEISPTPEQVKVIYLTTTPAPQK